MVCVAKEDREGRIACDYRDLNLIYNLFVYFAIHLLCSMCNRMYVVPFRIMVCPELCCTKTDMLIVQYCHYYVYSIVLYMSP